MSSFYPESMIRQLRPEDAEVYATFRRAALLDTPLAFMASPEDDMACSADAVRERLKAGGVIFGAFEPELIGTLGVYRDQHIKAAHKVHLWGMYARPSIGNKAPERSYLMLLSNMRVRSLALRWSGSASVRQFQRHSDSMSERAFEFGAQNPTRCGTTAKA